MTNDSFEECCFLLCGKLAINLQNIVDV